jgi:hypothetical protein
VEQAISLALALNAKLRMHTDESQVEVDRLICHIEALEGHVSRVENHSKHLQQFIDTRVSQYESSLSWKLSSPIRWTARTVKRFTQ